MIIIVGSLITTIFKELYTSSNNTNFSFHNLRIHKISPNHPNQLIEHLSDQEMKQALKII